VLPSFRGSPIRCNGHPASAKDSFHSGIGDSDNIAELLRQAEFDHAGE